MTSVCSNGNSPVTMNERARSSCIRLDIEGSNVSGLAPLSISVATSNPSPAMRCAMPRSGSMLTMTLLSAVAATPVHECIATDSTIATMLNNI